MIGLMVPSAFALEDKGEFYLVYSETETYKEYENWVKEWEYDDTTGMGYFEYQIEWLNSIFKLPYDIPIILGECEEINAWYYYEDNPSYSEIVICYELIEEIANYKSQQYEDDNIITESTINVVDFILYHELGHAYIHLYDLPITGAEEDVADQFSSYILLTSGQEGQDAALYVIDTAKYWLALSDDYEILEEHYAGVHSLDKQRFYNLACYVYGSNSVYNSDLIEQGWILDNRVDNCFEEYNQILKSWDRLLQGFVIFERTSWATSSEDDGTFTPPTREDKDYEENDEIMFDGRYLIHNTHGIKFKMPTGWSVNDYSTTESFYLNPNNGDELVSISVTVKPAIIGSFDAQMQHEVKKIRDALDNAAVIEMFDGVLIAEKIDGVVSDYTWMISVAYEDLSEDLNEEDAYGVGARINFENAENEISVLRCFSIMEINDNKVYTFQYCNLDENYEEDGGCGTVTTCVKLSDLHRTLEFISSEPHTANIPDIIIESESSEPINESVDEELESSGGGCLIATAAYGSEMAPQVQFLREIRDGTVMSTQSGTAFMTGFNQFYYSFSPQIADYERENPVFKEAVKVTLTPLLTSLTLLNYVDVDTEEEMLGYGIGIILLNVGMYFVAPAVLIISLKKRFL